MKQHQELMADILVNGTVKGDRTGTGTISKFGGMMKFNIQHGIWPIPTTREINHAQITQELEWMLKGLISVQWLKDHNNPIWNSWAGEKTGTIGPMYGEQWRNWNAGIGKTLSEEDEKRLLEMLEETARDGGQHQYPMTPELAAETVKEFLAEKALPYEQGGRSGTDQFMYIVDELKNNPDSRRMCLSVWHAALLPANGVSPKDNADNGKMALAPCHSMWQVDTKELSDLEILREVMWEFVLDDERLMMLDNQHLYDLNLFTVVLTATLFEEGWVNHKDGFKAHKTPAAEVLAVMRHETGVMPAGLRDRNLVVTEKGQAKIDEYRSMGKPARKLSLLCFARSQDVPLGTVYNVGEYSMLGHYLAHITNMVPWEYTHMMGDHHIYANQVECVEKQLERSPLRACRIRMPAMPENPDHFDHLRIVVDYVAHEKIVFPRAAV